MNHPVTTADMHRLAQALRAEHSKCDPPIANTLWNLHCQILETFPIPSPPVLPSPADDWRKECVVCTSSTKGFPGWGVYSPCGTYWLSLYTERWEQDKRGNVLAQRSHYDSESSARSALAKAPPYPGYTPPLPAKEEGDGCVDAAFVAANAGEYHAIGTSTDFVYASDGNPPRERKHMADSKTEPTVSPVSHNYALELEGPIADWVFDDPKEMDGVWSCNIARKEPAGNKGDHIAIICGGSAAQCRIRAIIFTTNGALASVLEASFSALSRYARGEPVLIKFDQPLAESPK